MKTLLFICLFISTFSIAQKRIVIGSAFSPPAVTSTSYIKDSTVQTFPTVAALRAASPGTFARTLGYWAKGDGGTAAYMWSDTSTRADDGGGYIKPTSVIGSGRWVLLPEGGEVSLAQFGAKAEWNNQSSRGYDNRPAIVNALNFCTGLQAGQYKYAKYKLHIPSATAFKYYYVSDSITITTGVELFGDPGGWTYLMFQNGKSGFHIPYVNYPAGNTTGTRTTYLHDISMQSEGSITKAGKNGVSIYALCRLERVTVGNFSGNGFYVYATAPSGNANNCYIANCVASGNAESGFFCDGADANNNTFVMCDASGNTQWGFRDNSFLGNNYFGCHAAENGLIGAAATMVELAGKWYNALEESVNIKPGFTSGWQNYWQLESDQTGLPAGGFHPTWDSTKHYYGGGSYYFSNPNQTGACFGCYIEGGQAPLYNKGGNLIVGGTTAQTTRTGGAFRVSVNGMEITNPASVPDANKVAFNAGGPTDASGFFGVHETDGWVTTGFAYNKTNKYLYTTQNNAGGSTLFFTNQTPAAFVGRTLAPSLGDAATNTGFLYRVQDNQTKYKRLSFWYAIPTGQAEVGDIAFCTNPSLNITGWRCTASGNPGTWQSF